MSNSLDETRDGTEPERCILCGGEASSFGSRTIDAGRLCGACVGKMSPWFRCRQDAAREELLAHLESRERNRETLAAFRPTLRLWKNPTVYLDEERRLFAVTDALVKEFPAENPDVLAYGQILQCDVEIEEHRTEVKRYAPGAGRVSYRPRRYDYRFHIWVRVLVDHPFFQELRFTLNRRPILVKSREVEASVQGKVVKSREYQACLRMAKEIQAILIKARDAVREEEEALAAETALQNAALCGMVEGNAAAADAPRSKE